MTRLHYSERNYNHNKENKSINRKNQIVLPRIPKSLDRWSLGQKITSLGSSPRDVTLPSLLQGEAV